MQLYHIKWKSTHGYDSENMSMIYHAKRQLKQIISLVIKSW